MKTISFPAYLAKLQRRYIEQFRVCCVDGFNVSVAFSSIAYSKRKKDGTLVSVELGFPSQDEPLLSTLAEDSNNLSDTVYPYVPVAVVDEILRKHGGIVDEFRSEHESD